MCRPGVIWGALFAAGLAAEAHALVAHHHDCTLSAMTRRTCRTDSPAGRTAFVAGSALVAVWFQYHIVTWKRELDAAGSP